MISLVGDDGAELTVQDQDRIGQRNGRRDVLVCRDASSFWSEIKRSRSVVGAKPTLRSLPNLLIGLGPEARGDNCATELDVESGSDPGSGVEEGLGSIVVQFHRLKIDGGQCQRPGVQDRRRGM